ncbi:MAG: hypothetical protein GTO17_05120 [Candidatus Aminicenantes bacterium]|nr:hypothetical protein [Candidatus Aminicenantes bacterium]
MKMERLNMSWRIRLLINLSLLSLLCYALSVYGEIRFTNATSRFGVKGYSYFGDHGVSWVDVNGDGKLDIYVKNVGAPKGPLELDNNLFINYGSYFQEEAVQRGVADGYAIGTHGAVFADLDNDQDFDLFSSTTYDGISPAYNHLYRNDGTGYFEDITANISPPQDVDNSTRGVAAADFDGDGDIDFFYSNPLSDSAWNRTTPLPPKNLKNFYLNSGDGTFTNEYRGIKWTGFVQGVAAVDIDGDGDIDIAEAKWAPVSTIYLNDGTGHFRDAGAEMGLPQTIDFRNNGMIFADVDNDRDLDLAIIGSHRLDLYENSDGYFTQYQTITNTGRTNRHYGYHVCFGDFDHDGDLDLYVSGSHMYENDGQGIFSQILSENAGLNASVYTADPRGSALGDFDNDGDLDIYISDKRDYNVLLRNQQNDSNWIQVEVIDNSGSVGGIGTKLDLYSAGHLGQGQYLKGHREIHGEYGYLGQDMPTAHFGVSASAQYDLRATFPNGEVKIIRNITPGQKIQVAFILAPLNLNGIRGENKTLFYRESVITLTWEANPGNENIIKYRIYLVDEAGLKTFLDEVYADTFSYIVRDVDRDQTYRFALTAVDQNEAEGAAAYTTVE